MATRFIKDPDSGRDAGSSGLSDVDVDPESKPASARFPGLVATIAVIAFSVFMVGWRLADSYTFANDDLIQFEVADRFGLSSELLMLNVWGHFSPFNRFFHWLILNTGLNTVVGTLLAVGMVTCLLVVTAWLTYELGLSLVRRLLVLAATGGALSVLESAVWSDAVYHVLAALVVTYLIIALHLHAIRTHRPVYHVVSVVVFAFGLLIQERTAFALPLAVLVDVLIYWRDLPVKQRLLRLWTVKWPLACMAAIGAVAAYLLLANYGGEGSPPPPTLAVRAALLALTNFQFPQLLGYQPQNTLALPQQLTVLLVIVLAAALLILVNRRNVGPVLFFFLTFALYWGFLVFSPILFETSLIETASRLHNSAYVLVPAYISLFSLSLPPAMSNFLGTRCSRVKPMATATTVFLVLVAVTISGSVFTSANWGRYQSAHNYWEGVRESAPVWSDPDRTVLPLESPRGIATSWAVPLGRHDVLLPFVKRGWRPAVGTQQPTIITENGEVREAELQLISPGSAANSVEASDATSDSQSTFCDSPVLREDPSSFTFDRPLTVGPFIARVRYESDSPSRIKAVAMLGRTAKHFAASTDLPSGSHDVLLYLGSERFDWLRTSSMVEGTNICVHQLDIVRPVQLEPDGSCWLIESVGKTTGSRTSCRTVGDG